MSWLPARPSPPEAALERYYAPEQRTALARQAGVAPSDGRVQALAGRARDLIDAFTGGDRGIRAFLERLYREGEGVAALRRQGMGVDAALWEYYCQVMKAGA